MNVQNLGSKVYKKLNMVEVEEEETPLPISCINDHKDQFPMDKNDVVINVKDCLKELLMKRPVPVNESPSSEKTIKPSIYKIPKFMKDIQLKAYEPYLVSFGPYHHGVEHLAPMEKEKQKVFQHLVKGDNNAATYESIASEVSNILEDLYAAYDNLDEKWRKDVVASAKFMEMMIIDACFILVFFSKDKSYKSLMTLRSDIKRDILLLENQLPFQLLQLLYKILPIKDQNKSLTSLICKLWFVKKDELTVKGGKHILEMYRMLLLDPIPIVLSERDESQKKAEGTKGNKKEKDESVLNSQIIPQATLLHDAGIKFRRSETESLIDIGFKNGVLELPHLTVDDDTETKLLNVMAFEKLHGNVRSYVTSFVVLMNNLIDIDKDVELLSENKIIDNALGNDEDAAKLFTVLGKGVALDLESNIAKVHRLVNKHCDGRCNRWCANLKHNYFQNPWAIISLIGAIFGFLILIVQAVYQIIDYHTRK
ncbi:hypothetical protein IC582_027335 [Cucumis melo]